MVLERGVGMGSFWEKRFAVADGRRFDPAVGEEGAGSDEEGAGEGEQRDPGELGQAGQRVEAEGMQGRENRPMDEVGGIGDAAEPLGGFGGEDGAQAAEKDAWRRMAALEGSEKDEGPDGEG